MPDVITKLLHVWEHWMSTCSIPHWWLSEVHWIKSEGFSACIYFSPEFTIFGGKLKKLFGSSQSRGRACCKCFCISSQSLCVCNVFTLQNPLQARQHTSASATSTDNTPGHTQGSSHLNGSHKNLGEMVLCWTWSSVGTSMGTQLQVKDEVLAMWEWSSFLLFNMGWGQTDLWSSLWIMIQVVGDKVNLMNQDQLYSQMILGQRHRAHKVNLEHLIVPENTPVRNIAWRQWEPADKVSHGWNGDNWETVCMPCTPRIEPSVENKHLRVYSDV